MAKSFRDAPLRAIADTLGKGAWLRSKGHGHPGFDELLRPGSTRKARPANQVQKRWTPKPHRPQRVNDPKPVVVPSAEPAPQSILPVPIPSERVRPVDVTYASREGQAEFRAAILAAYGRCAVTGYQVEAVLQAAHIIPYVDARSNLISNGLCLRADVHCLYDRNLIKIAGDGGIAVDGTIECPEYRALHGRQIGVPEARAHKPNPLLLDVRHQYVKGNDGGDS